MKSYFTHPNIELLTKNIPESENIEKHIKYDPLEEIDQKELDRYLKLIKPEIEKYSSKFLHNVGLRRISFVKNLRVHNEISNTFPLVHSSTDTQTKQYIIDIINGNEFPEYQIKCFHHELFHLIEININGVYKYYDKTWIGLNPSGFKYGQGGAYAHTIDNWENKVHPSEGFITSYAMLGVDEDRAETFAYVMTDHLQEDLNKYMKEDKILRNKVNYLKQFIDKLNN